MIKNLVLVSQSYLGFATDETLAHAASRARISLVLDAEEKIHPRLAPHVAEVHRLTGTVRHTLQPSFDVAELTALVRSVLTASGGDPAELALFCQNEDNVVPVAHVRELLGIAGDGPELVRRFRDKVVMKQALAARLPEVLPRYRRLDLDRIDADAASYFTELVAELGTDTLIVKPTGGAGSLNVAVIAGAADLVTAAARIRADSREFAYEVDEHLQGTMYQCDSFVRDGKVVFSGILELGCSNFDFVQGRPLSVHPVTDEELYGRLFAYNQDVVSALGFRDGSTHHELFVRRTADGGITTKFVEIAARVPGGLGVPFHERNSGINLIDANLWLALGDPRADSVTFDRRDNVVSALLPVGRGRVVALNEPELASAYSIGWNVAVGDTVDPRSLIDNAGILTLTHDDPAVLRRDFESLATYVPVTCR
ncbi:hypothetical protein GCM10027589_33740 [Actinocorallia lasiicapitis]